MSDVGHRRIYTYDEKVEAVKAHLERGLSTKEAMELAGATSKSAFYRWCSTYKLEGLDSLKPKKRGRPRKD